MDYALTLGITWPIALDIPSFWQYYKLTLVSEPHSFSMAPKNTWTTHNPSPLPEGPPEASVPQEEEPLSPLIPSELPHTLPTFRNHPLSPLTIPMMMSPLQTWPRPLCWWLKSSGCYDFRRLRQSLTVVVSKVWSQMSLEECKSWTCIVLLGLRVKVQVKGLSIKD